MIASVVFPALDDPFRKMTFPTFIAADGIWKPAERQFAGETDVSIRAH
ncbi:MAG: hypothetical protein AB7O54_08610 [Pseudomonadales bacterium]